MSNSKVETVSSKADRLKLALAVLVIVAGIVGYSMLEGQPTVLRLGAFLVSVIVAGFIAWSSEPGKRSMSFGRDAYNEIKRVVWPSRSETIRMTGIVFAFVIVVGAFLWLVDKILQWLIFGVLLGWN
ncbi:preprotein translocase subunit SecE [Achromobacter sp. F4_2707]|uniref:preprotein translocase subunit SecE n=1 Tax=Achromobacter sp. F4_2707 TaxID=3114286 RepID=UPI0039C5E8A3